MKKGDIIFVQGKSLISKLIRYFDNEGTFSHVAIAIDDDRIVEVDVDTKVAINHLDKSKYSVIEVLDLGLTPNERREVVYEAFKLLGTKYDYIQLLWYVLRKLFNLKGKNRLNNPKYVICSELVFKIFNKSGILIELGLSKTYKNGQDLTPNELYDLVKYVSKRQIILN